MRESGCTAVHYNAAYEPWRAESDERVSEALRARGVAAVRLRRSLCSAETPTLALGPDPASTPDPSPDPDPDPNQVRHRGNLLYEPWDARPDERSTSAGFGSVGFFLSAVQAPPCNPHRTPPATRMHAACNPNYTRPASLITRGLQASSLCP